MTAAANPRPELAADTTRKPADVTCWVWFHHSFDDLPLWQECLIAASSAQVEDVVGTATKMYAVRGGRARR
jgi:hypothetical protein